MDPRTYRIGAATITLYPCGTTTTRFSDGREVIAAAEETPEYRARARALGYAEDIVLMSQEHELLHSYCAEILGLEESKTLAGVARGKFWAHWHDEECLVLAMQKMCRTLGISVEELVTKVR